MEPPDSASGALGRGEIRMSGLALTTSSGLGLEPCSEVRACSRGESSRATCCGGLSASVGSAAVGNTAGVADVVCSTDPSPPGIRLGPSANSVGDGSAKVGEAAVEWGTGVGLATQPSSSARVGVGSASTAGVATISAGTGWSKLGSTCVEVSLVVGSGASTHPARNASEVEPHQTPIRASQFRCRG